MEENTATLIEKKTSLEEAYRSIKRKVEKNKLPIILPEDEVFFKQTRQDAKGCVPYTDLEPLLRIRIPYTENLQGYVEYPYDETTYLSSGLYMVKGAAGASYAEITYTGDMIPARDGDIPGYCGIRFISGEELKEEARFWARKASALEHIDKNYESPTNASYFLSEWDCFNLDKELFENIPQAAPMPDYEPKNHQNPSAIYPEYVWDRDTYLNIPWPCDGIEIKAQTARIKKQIETLPEDQKKLFSAEEIESRLHCDEKAMEIKEAMVGISKLSKELVKINRMLPEMKAEVIANDILFSFRFGNAINRAGHSVEGLSEISGSMITFPKIQELVDEANELGIYDEVDRIIREKEKEGGTKKRKHPSR